MGEASFPAGKPLERFNQAFLLGPVPDLSKDSSRTGPGSKPVLLPGPTGFWGEDAGCERRLQHLAHHSSLGVRASARDVWGFGSGAAGGEGGRGSPAGSRWELKGW